MYRKAYRALSYHFFKPVYHSTMNHDNEDTQSLLDSNEQDANKIGINIEDSSFRNQRKPVKMTGLLQYFIVFAVFVSFVYSIQFVVSDRVINSFKGKPTFSEHHNNLNTSEIKQQSYTEILSEGSVKTPDLKWTYDCTNNQCIRRLVNENELPVSLKICNMLCDQPGLWPKPKFVTISRQNLSTFKKSSISTNIRAPKKVEKDLKQAVDIFMVNLPKTERYWSEDVELTNVFVNINVNRKITKIKINTDESYNLTITKTKDFVAANISANTYFGARHGLETLSQLMVLDTHSKKLKIYHDIEIQDKPTFAHRGLMVDTSRNFFPIKQLLTVVDGMAMNKMNVFHLHLTDAVSFPIVLPSNPWMAKYGAYSSDMIYSPEDIKGLIEYARIRGIRVILEIDAPSHVNEGWNHLNTEKEKTIICGENNVLNGHLNPDNTETQKLLKTVYSDLIELGTDTETFHIGGDEVNLTCLSKTKAASKFNDLNKFWADYMNTIFKTVTTAFNNTAPTNLVIWSSDLTDWYLDSLKYSKNLVIQYWFGKLEPILQNGNKIIFSTVGKWYLDCGFGSWKPSSTQGSCDPYTPWQTFYNYRPWKGYHNLNQVLGGEACLWSEQVGVDNLETRIWPRTAALAERLWSDLPRLNLREVTTRLLDQRERLIERGIKVSTVWPRWCTLNPGKCID